MKKYKYLQLADRKRLAKMYERGDRIKDIAAALGVNQNTVYNEIERGFTGKLDVNQRRQYDPNRAQKAVMDGLRRRGKNFAPQAEMRAAHERRTHRRAGRAGDREAQGQRICQARPQRRSRALCAAQLSVPAPRP